MFGWKKMGIMEPDWYEADFQGTTYSLHMTWDETKWLLCVEQENEDQPYRSLFDTEEQVIDLAKVKAESWFLATRNQELEAIGAQMLEALENLENDDGLRMPASAWLMVQVAIQAAGGTPKPIFDTGCDAPLKKADPLAIQIMRDDEDTIQSLNQERKALIEALEAMVCTHPYSPPCDSWKQKAEAHKQARAALAKAKGETAR